MKSLLNTIFIFIPMLAAIGALNWGLVGALGWDAVAAVAGGATRHDVTTATRVIYVLVGIAGAVTLVEAIRNADSMLPRFK